MTIPATLWALVGISGAAYAVIVGKRMRVQEVYRPDFEDSVFNVLLPLAAYTILAVSGFAALSPTHQAPFGGGAAAVLLLFLWIHNAWGGGTYHVFVNKPDVNKDGR